MTSLATILRSFLEWLSGITITVVFVVSVYLMVAETVKDIKEAYRCKARIIELEKALKQYQEGK